MYAFNFHIQPGAAVSDAFLLRSVVDFITAVQYVKQLPYHRNSDKNNPLIVMKEQCGTCGSKHALLARLAAENGYEEVQLYMGIFRMNGRNTPALGTLLKKYNLGYIPEAHNYLRINGHLVDVTMPDKQLDFVNDLMTEMPVQPGDISEKKVMLHRGFLENWIKNEQVPYDLDEIWRIRETCIALWPDNTKKSISFVLKI